MFEEGSEGYHPKVQILATLVKGGWTEAAFLANDNAGVLRKEIMRPFWKGTGCHVQSQNLFKNEKTASIQDLAGTDQERLKKCSEM